MADNFKRVSATGTGSLVVIATVPSSNLSTTPPTEPATFILKNVTVSNKSGGAVTAGRATGGDAVGDDGAALGVGAGAGGDGGSGGGGAVLVAACRLRSAIARANSGSSGRPLMVESGFQGAGAPGSRCCRAGMWRMALSSSRASMLCRSRR